MDKNIPTPLKSVTRDKGGTITRLFDRATTRLQAAQRELLLDILKRNRATEYGKEHFFSRLSDATAFTRAVPVNTFSDLAPYVQKMKEGRRDILTSGKLCRFNLTSGTTDEPKYVPVSRTGMTREAAATIQWLYRALRDHPSFLDHSVLCVTGALVEGSTPCGVPCGSASGMLYRSLRSLSPRSFALPPVLSEIKDYALRYFLTARLALEKEVSFVVTPSPATLVRIAEVGIRHQQEIVRSIHDGVLARWESFDRSREDSGVLRALCAGVEPNPQRARVLDRVIGRHGRLRPGECWKRLRLIGCWLGGSIGFQADRLSEHFGDDVARRDIGYRTSEGSFTIPHRDHSPGGILAVRDHYFEFIPASEADRLSKRILGCHELEQGKQYRIIVTNYNGLYRYDMNDVVEVQDFYNQTPIIAFARKGADVLNIAGEKLHANHFLKAFEILKERFNLVAVQFRVAPDCKELRCEVFLHVEPEPSRDFLLGTVLPFLDRSLAEANIEYEGKRRSGRLNAPCLHVMDASWEEESRRSFLAAGHRDIQYKWRTVVEKASALDRRHVRFTVKGREEPR